MNDTEKLAQALRDMLYSFECDVGNQRYPDEYRVGLINRAKDALAVHERAQPEGVPDDIRIEVHQKGKRYQVWLIRDHQSFEVGPSRRAFAETKWYADMLAKALWPQPPSEAQP